MINRELYSPELEKTYWWFRGRRAILSRLLSRFVSGAQSRSLKILEVGCGTGGNFEVLSQHGHVVGLDIALGAFAHSEGQWPLVLGDGLRLPFREQTFDAVFALDLLEHLEDDGALLREFSRVLRDDGSLVLTVPAVKSLWSGHDVALAHWRRYARKELVGKVNSAGFQIRKLTFALGLLFPLIYVFRKLQNLFFKLGRRKQHPAGIVRLPRLLNGLFVLLLKLEAGILPWVSLPFGVSLVCVATKSRRKAELPPGRESAGLVPDPPPNQEGQAAHNGEQ